MNEEFPAYKGWYESPIGWIELAVTDSAVTQLYFKEAKTSDSAKHALLDRCYSQLDDYFHGALMEFDLPLSPAGTEFQKKVWTELLRIRYGQVITYRDLGIRLGGPNFTRIVGQANGKNPISLIIPCHRVIGMNGALTGYGGGLWRKKWLLDFEHRSLSGFTHSLF